MTDRIVLITVAAEVVTARLACQHQPHRSLDDCAVAAAVYLAKVFDRELSAGAAADKAAELEERTLDLLYPEEESI